METQGYNFNIDEFAKQKNKLLILIVIFSVLKKEITGFPTWKWQIREDKYQAKSILFSPETDTIYDDPQNIEEFLIKFNRCERIKESGLIDRGTQYEQKQSNEMQTIKIESQQDEKKIIDLLNIMGKLAKQKELKMINKLLGMTIIDKICYFFYESGLFSISQPLLQGVVYKQDKVIQILKQVANTMRILESLGIAHQSLSTLSITYCDYDKIFKLGNWQNACFIEPPSKYLKTNYIGSSVYCSCEMLDATENQLINYSPFKGDVFSLALVGLRMCGIHDDKILEAKKSKEWNQANFYELFKQIEKSHGKISKVLNLMLNRNAALRPSWLTVCDLLEEIMPSEESENPIDDQYYYLSFLSYYLNGCYIAYQDQDWKQCQVIGKVSLKLIEDISNLTEQIKEFQIQFTFMQALGLTGKQDPCSLEEFQNAQKLSEEFAQETGRTLKIYPFIFKRIAQKYAQDRQIDKALEYYNLAIDSLKKVFNESNIEIAKIYHEQNSYQSYHFIQRIGLIFIKEEQYEKALENLSQGMQIWKSIYGEKEIPLSTYYNNIALCCKLLAKYEDALSNLELSFKIIEEMVGTNSQQAVTRLNNIALILKLMNNEEGSLEKVKELIIKMEERKMQITGTPEEILQNLNFIEEELDHPNLDIKFALECKQSKLTNFTLKGPEIKEKPKKRRVKKVVEEQE